MCTYMLSRTTRTHNRNARRAVGRSSTKTNTLAASFNPFSGLGKSVGSMLSGATGSVPVDFEDKAPSWEVRRRLKHSSCKAKQHQTQRW